MPLIKEIKVLSDGIAGCVFPLRELNVSGRKVGAEVIAALLHALKDCNGRLASINLNATAKGTEGMPSPLVNQITGMLKDSVRSLLLGYNGPWPEESGRELVTALGSASCVVENIDVNGSEISAADAVQIVTTSGTLKQLNLTGDSTNSMNLHDLRSGKSCLLYTSPSPRD